MADNLNNSSTTADNTKASVDPRAEVVVVEIPSQDLKPSITEDEETLIAKMYNLVGERWSLIAGRIPGRTAEEIKKYWNSICSSTDQ